MVGTSGRTAGLAGLSGNNNTHVFRVHSISRKNACVIVFDQNIHFAIAENAHFLAFLF